MSRDDKDVIRVLNLRIKELMESKVAADKFIFSERSMLYSKLELLHSVLEDIYGDISGIPDKQASVPEWVRVRCTDVMTRIDSILRNDKRPVLPRNDGPDMWGTRP
jgi:hypothetical protein